MTFVVRNARILTLAAGTRPLRGPDLNDLGIIPLGDVHVENGNIVRVAPPNSVVRAEREIDARGRVLMPGFVDCHTHACWAGDRYGEWEQRLRGATYLDILHAGGGIMRTVRDVRSASDIAIEEGLQRRLDQLLARGTTTVEVKSGYGLTTLDELRMLHAICAASAGWGGTVQPTALLGHAIDGNEHDFVEQTVYGTLPALHARYPGITVDAFCEQGAWGVAATRLLLEGARSLGHPIRLHADQFTSTGAVQLGIELGARSVDHLEASGSDVHQALAASSTIGVMLPVTGFHLDGRYADGRALVDAGAAVAVASNWNPGSAPSGSMPFALALAVRHNGLTPAEAIAAGTVNAAHALGLTDRGMIAAGMRADLLLLDTADERAITCDIGGPPIAMVMAGGVVVADAGISNGVALPRH